MDRDIEDSDVINSTGRLKKGFSGVNGFQSDSDRLSLNTDRTRSAVVGSLTLKYNQVHLNLSRNQN